MKSGPFADRHGVGGGHDAELGPGLGGEDLDLEPGAEPGLVGEEAGHLGQRVARDQGGPSSCRTLYEPETARTRPWACPQVEIGGRGDQDEEGVGGDELRQALDRARRRAMRRMRPALVCSVSRPSAARTATRCAASPARWSSPGCGPAVGSAEPRCGLRARFGGRRGGGDVAAVAACRARRSGRRRRRRASRAADRSGPDRGDGEHAPAGGEERAVGVARGPGVEDRDPVDRGGGVEARRWRRRCAATPGSPRRPARRSRTRRRANATASGSAGRPRPRSSAGEVATRGGAAPPGTRGRRSARCTRSPSGRRRSA